MWSPDLRLTEERVSRWDASMQQTPFQFSLIIYPLRSSGYRINEGLVYLCINFFICRFQIVGIPVCFHLLNIAKEPFQGDMGHKTTFELFRLLNNECCRQFCERVGMNHQCNIKITGISRVFFRVISCTSLPAVQNRFSGRLRARV